jgi:hypothetical protein
MTHRSSAIEKQFTDNPPLAGCPDNPAAAARIRGRRELPADSSDNGEKLMHRFTRAAVGAAAATAATLVRIFN